MRAEVESLLESLFQKFNHFVKRLAPLSEVSWSDGRLTNEIADFTENFDRLHVADLLSSAVVRCIQPLDLDVKELSQH